MSESTSSGGNASVGQSARLSYEHAKDAARQVVGTVRERAGAYYQQGKEKAGELTEKTQDYVREQPIKSVLIAAGVGLLLGILLRRR